MKFDSRKNLRNLDEFLADDTDLSLDQVKAELRAAGADMTSFRARIREIVTGAAPAAQKIPLREIPADLDARQVTEMFRQILAGDYGDDLQAAALTQAETRIGEPAAADLRDVLTRVSAKPLRQWSEYPVQEMIRRGWIKDSLTSLQGFFEHASVSTPVFCRKTDHIRSARAMDPHALSAWATRVVIEASRIKGLAKYRPGSVTLEFMRALAQKSRCDRGPAAAQQFLCEIGIPLVIEPHLPQTYLDGAAIIMTARRPIIGLTIRHDRLDNFWFTLMHEVAHVHLHASLGEIGFFDDLDVATASDPREKEADQLAGEALIPEHIWLQSAARNSRMPQAAESLATKLHIHTAIVAGRMRHHWKAFRLFNNLVGHHQVRSQFTRIKWPT